MSDFDYDDDDNYSDTSGTDLVKQLRKQLREASRERDELRTQNAALTQSTRKSSLSNILASKNVNPKLASFLAKDEVEPTDEAVTKWLADYGDVFNVSGTASDAGNEPAPAAQTQDAAYRAPAAPGDDAAILAFQQMQAATQRAQVGSTPTATPAATAEAALFAAAGDAKTPDQFFEALRRQRP